MRDGYRRVASFRIATLGAMPQKRYLLTPGPTPVPPEVLAALAEPVIHHRSPDFKAVFSETLQRLREVFRTENEVLVFTASGTGAFESAVANLLSPGEKVLAVSHGNFGTRWQKMAAAFGCDVVPLTYDWGTAPLADDVSRALAESGAEVAFLVHSETSTGVVSDIRSLVAACNEAGAISVVDAISSLGAVPLETDAWGIDVVVTGSQKALDDTARPRIRLRLGASLGEGRAGHAAAVLLGLVASPVEPGEGQHAVHPCNLDGGGSERRAGADSRRGARERLRPACRNRPRLSCGRKGDGSRSVLARRRQRRGADRDPDARRGSTPSSFASRSATATASRSRVATAT